MSRIILCLLVWICLIERVAGGCGETDQEIQFSKGHTRFMVQQVNSFYSPNGSPTNSTTLNTNLRNRAGVDDIISFTTAEVRVAITFTEPLRVVRMCVQVNSGVIPSVVFDLDQGERSVSLMHEADGWTRVCCTRRNGCMPDDNSYLEIRLKLTNDEKNAITPAFRSVYVKACKE